MKKIRKFYAAVLAGVFLLTAVVPVKVFAASGTVYSCSITPSYQHPVTGVIEDSGGAASYATGQGMVEGCIYTTGMLEVTDAGEYYLTFRVSLVDYTTDHSFKVQNVDDSGWSSTGMAVTATGTDSNGTTADICIQVPSESCVVRGSMYVTPMGRNVVFYFYPSNYTEGNTTGMTPTMVTESASSVETESSMETTAAEEASGTTETESVEPESQAAVSAGTVEQVQSPAMESTGNEVEQIAGVSAGAAASDSSLNAAQGLSLSTAPESTTDTGNTGNNGSGMSALGLGMAITISGMILMCVAAGLVYYFRINWRRWGGGDDDEE